MTVYVLENGELVVKREGVERRMQIVRDIQPYTSMVDGSTISSRSRHREHLKAHGCVEVGNEQPPAPQPYETPKAQRDARKRALYGQFENLNQRQISRIAQELREHVSRR
jgi:hypothetical protein